MTEEVLSDKMTFEQRPERGGRELSGWCPSVNCNPNLGFLLLILFKLKQLPLGEEDADVQENSRRKSPILDI